MEKPQPLRCILIHFQDGLAILPDSTVVEVLPYAKPLFIEGAPPWVMGAFLWKAVTIPLISLERLVNRVNPGANLHTRIVVVNALGHDPKLRNFGFLGTEAPQLLDVYREDMKPHDNVEPVPGVLGRALFRGQEAVIPDMRAVESVLSRLVRI